MPTGKTPRSASWVGGKVLQHYYNVPSLKQQNKASTILSEIMLPETSNIDDVVNDQTEHKNDTPAIENVAVDIQNPTNSQSVMNNLNSNTNSNLIASRKKTNHFSILWATISRGVINLNIFSGKRKLDMLDSSQEYNLFCFGIKQNFLININ